jgi:hypothetical protein
MVKQSAKANREETEFERFDVIVRQAFGVPHEEIVRREKEYKRKRKQAKEKRAKASPAFRASNGKD